MNKILKKKWLDKNTSGDLFCSWLLVVSENGKENTMHVKKMSIF